MAEAEVGKAGKVVRDLHQASSFSSDGVLGQNQSVMAAPEGSRPQTIAQGVKIEPSKVRLITSAETKGQTDGGGEVSRKSGSASTRVVLTISRRSARRPVA